MFIGSFIKLLKKIFFCHFKYCHLFCCHAGIIRSFYKTIHSGRESKTFRQFLACFLHQLNELIKNSLNDSHLSRIKPWDQNNDPSYILLLYTKCINNFKERRWKSNLNASGIGNLQRKIKKKAKILNRLKLSTLVLRIRAVVHKTNN